MVATKKCIACGEEKLLTDEFFTYRSDTKKYKNTCRVCVRKQNAARDEKLKLENPELYNAKKTKIRNTQNRWRQNQPKKPITKYFIYVIQNKINNKIYVGYTYNVSVRWRNHKSDAKKGSGYPIHRAIRKYGWENFHKMIIEEWASLQDTLDAEMFWIAFFRTNINKYGKEYGYNLNDGGSNSSGMLVNKASEETKLKMSKAQSGRKLTEEIKLKISMAKKGKPSPLKGKPITEEHKQNLRKPKTNKPKLRHNLSDDTIKEICNSKLSVRKLAKLHNVGRSTIKNIIKRNNK